MPADREERPMLSSWGRLRHREALVGAALGSARLPICEQLGALRRGYARHAPPFGEPDELLVRLARLHAPIRTPVAWTPGPIR